MWRWMSFERLLQDIRYGLRVLGKSPGYAVVAIFSLALGIGANTAIFSLINALMLKSLPVRDPWQLVTVGDPSWTGTVSRGGGGRTEIFSYAFFQRFHERNQVFNDVYATGRSEYIEIAVPGERTFSTQAGEPRGRFVSGNYFSVLGISPFVGRTFTWEETKRPGAAPVAVISYGYWERQFARNPRIVGTRILVNGSPFSIVGVAPPEFFGDIVGRPTDIWFPVTMHDAANRGYGALNDPNTYWLLLMGRLKPGVSLQQASAATSVLSAQIFRELYLSHAKPNEYQGLLHRPVAVGAGTRGFSRMRRDFSKPLLMLMGVVGLVLLICCANVANLQLARAAGRKREINLRLAVGAGRLRLLRQLLTESMLLSITGGALALLVALWTSHLLLLLVSGGPELPLEVHLDTQVLLFTASVSILAGLIFGIVPAWQSTQTDLVSCMKDARGGQARGSSQFVGKLLIVAQVVFSMILLVGAGLFLRTLHNLENAEVGYSRSGLLLGSIDFKTGGYDSNTLGPLSHRLIEELRRAPGVQAVTVSANGLFSGTDSESDAVVEGYTPGNEADRINHSDRVGPDYFQAVGTRVLAGRGITSQDGENAPKVAVINDTMARFCFPHNNPIGKHIFGGDDHKIAFTIVGVVADTKQSSVREAVPRRFYLPYWQVLHTDPLDALNVEVRTRGLSAHVMSSIRTTIKKVDAKLPVPSLKSADDLIDDTLDQEKLIAKLSGLFGVLALTLAAIGLYGVMSYLTVQRTVEIGIRMALGAGRKTVVAMVMRETFVLVLAGVVIGTCAALAMTSLLQSMLYGLSSFVFVGLLAAAAVILLASGVATFLPARRASRVEPTVALRCE